MSADLIPNGGIIQVIAKAEIVNIFLCLFLSSGNKGNSEYIQAIGSSATGQNEYIYQPSSSPHLRQPDTINTININNPDTTPRIPTSRNITAKNAPLSERKIAFTEFALSEFALPKFATKY